MQRRRREIWMLQEIPKYKGTRKQTMNDILIPLDEAKKIQFEL